MFKLEGDCKFDTVLTMNECQTCNKVFNKCYIRMLPFLLPLRYLLAPNDNIETLVGFKFYSYGFSKAKVLKFRLYHQKSSHF